MATFGIFTEAGIFQLNKVTHMGAGIKHAAWTQSSEGACIAALPHHSSIKVAVGFYDNTFAQGAVFDHAIRANHHIVFNHHATFKNHVDVDEHIATDCDLATHIETSRVTQGHTQSH